MTTFQKSVKTAGLGLTSIHHVALIVSDFEKSKTFYTEILGLKIIREIFRAERNSYKLDLSLPSGEILEIFSFPNSPPRPSYPEALGLRHLAFATKDLDDSVRWLKLQGIHTEAVRTDEFTHRKFTFFTDPDGLPLELYQDLA
jgi:glyoxylase I family protein